MTVQCAQRRRLLPAFRDPGDALGPLPTTCSHLLRSAARQSDTSGRGPAPGRPGAPPPPPVAAPQPRGLGARREGGSAPPAPGRGSARLGGRPSLSCPYGKRALKYCIVFSFLEVTSSSKPHPPVVGKVTHHSIELYWDLEKKAKRPGPQEQWFRFSIEEEDPKLHTYGIIYTGYATKHVVEGLEPRTLYRFRLKVTSPSGEHAYSPVVSVSTTREPISSEHLHRAVNVNDEDLLVHILQGGNVKVDVPNKFGFTALMVAAQRGYTRLVKILVSHGTDVNLQNGSGKDSLMLACYAGHLDVVKYLRRHGASWDTRDLGGCTALHWAADGGHCNVIEWMIGDGCEVDVVDAGSRWTPLMRVSAVSGNQEVASLLIDAGADVNVKDKDGKTPLMVAVLNNHEELVQLLLDRGADASVKNEFGKGILEMARVFDRQNVLSLLEERKRKQMPKKSSIR
ncbi:unnamed protein product [Rangifer tarandus platyrhynchus]|uniref:Uncharacterized protein n=2 Tax=Rangifer tarandus platyrhynchus TaxID=3082113 RepID=A0ACB0FFK9_RANTA|nr:unnamed protein product [Rangifer tarandus platyrhynchus]CAI9711288.1 unnamed protein product [Rangifer tarandus platyrhynchus]